MSRLLVGALVCFGLLGVAAGCLGSSSSDRAALTSQSTPVPPGVGAPLGEVVFGLGVSTDPYGSSSSGRGFGVATGLPSGHLSSVATGRGWNGQTVTWIAPGVIQVERAHPPRYALFSYKTGRLAQTRRLPLPWRLGAVIAWSQDRSQIAAEPSISVPPAAGEIVTGGTALSGRILIQRASGSTPRPVASGDLLGWTPTGRVVFRSRARTANLDASPILTIDPHTGRTHALFTAAVIARRAHVTGKVLMAAPVWSADHHYLAMLAAIQHRSSAKTARDTIVIAHANGRIIRFITSPYIISMFAWSPHGHRLAYTTSGFSEPHQLLLINTPNSNPQRLFQTTNRHFDWITWSPDNHWLLLDDEQAGHWRLLPSTGGTTTRLLPRLGGRPLWCCPQNPYYAQYAN